MIHLFKKQLSPEQPFLDSIQITNSMKTTVSQTRCPSCDQKTLELVRTEQGKKRLKKRFETEILCKNYHFSGISNSTGFQFLKINSKERPRI